MEKDLSEWLLKCEESLGKDPTSANLDENVINAVPESLLHDKKINSFYIPLISIGPHNFNPNASSGDDVEILKSDVATKMHREMLAAAESQVALDIIPEVAAERSTKNETPCGLYEVIKKFKGKEIQAKMRASYAKDFSALDHEKWAWMMARDACLVIEVVKRFSQDKIEEPKLWIDIILNRKRYHPLWNDIVKDMFKLQNQLPLWVLEEIRFHLGWFDQYWFEPTLQNISPVEVTHEGCKRKYRSKLHILQLLHDYIVDEPSDNNSSRAPSTRSWSEIWLSVVFVFVVLLLSPFLVIYAAIWAIIQSCRSPEAEGSHVPSLVELKEIGFKFKGLEGKGISHIEFEEATSTLYLPKFNVNDRSEVILRNLVALEIFSKDEEKPITRYVLLMNDLINTAADIAVLREQGIIRNMLGSDKEAAQLWNSLVSTEMPTYPPIDHAISGIHTYLKNKSKVFWGQLASYFSKPRLILSSLGGILVVLFTLVQAFCSFESCLIS